MLKRTKLISLYAALFMGTTGAHAAPMALTGFQLGLDAGQAEARKYCDNVANCDSADTSLRLSAGYQFTPNVGAELGYTSFGTLFNADNSTVVAKQDARAWTLSVLGTMPFTEKFGLLGRLGMASYNVNNSGTIQGLPIESKNSTKPYVGLGAKFNLTDSFALRAEYQVYTDISGVDGVKDNVRGIYAGGVFSFGGGGSVY